MPTVLRKDGFSFRIYYDDHIPAHVHVFKADGEAKIELGNDFTEPTLVTLYKMNNKDAKRALEIATEYQAELLERWIKIHG
ncbi:MAG: DUF4160 domain-containing protein [Nodosilinea sp.]